MTKKKQWGYYALVEVVSEDMSLVWLLRVELRLVVFEGRVPYMIFFSQSSRSSCK